VRLLTLATALTASDIGDMVSGVLGIVLWPLVLLGINLQI
jgi:hypothetical protein